MEEKKLIIMLIKKNEFKDCVNKRQTFHRTNLFLLNSDGLHFSTGGSKKEDDAKTYLYNIDYLSKNQESNANEIIDAITRLKNEVFKKLKGLKSDDYKSETTNKAISSIMQILAKEKGKQYWKHMVTEFMKTKKDGDENQVDNNNIGSSKKAETFEDSKTFEDLMEKLMRHGSFGNNVESVKEEELNVVDGMMKFSSDSSVLLKVLKDLGVGVKSKDRILNSKYFRFALCTSATLGIASVAGIPVMSMAFIKLAVSCYFGVKLLDLRHQNFVTYVGNNLKDIIHGTKKVIKATSSVIGGISSLFGGNSSI